MSETVLSIPALDAAAAPDLASPPLDVDIVTKTSRTSHRAGRLQLL
jgi:hypothetical protein